MGRVAGLFNTILFRVFGMTFGVLSVALFLFVAVLQTPASNHVAKATLEESATSIAELVWLLEGASGETEAALLSTYSSNSRVARIAAGFDRRLAADQSKRRLLARHEGAAAARLQPREILFRRIVFWELLQSPADAPPRPFNALNALQVAIELADGRVLNVWLAPSLLYTGPPYGLVVLLGIAALVTLILGLALSWVILRPIRALERDAELVGLAETALPVAETGPRELRQLARALNRMRARLAGLIREREQMMIAIAHDLRTSLTKIRLRTQDAQSSVVTQIEPDLAQMEHLLADLMAYARAENPVTEHELITICDLVSSLAQSAPYAVTLEIEERCGQFSIAGSRIALTRMFENLLENARRYGAGLVLVRIREARAGLLVSIEDNGPGVPDDSLERVFEPFARGENSRNRATGGTGLGLGIARAIAHTHGAKITLDNRDEGGLRASILFPGWMAAF